MARSANRAQAAAHAATRLAAELAQRAERLKSYKAADVQSALLGAVLARFREHLDGQTERQNRLLYLEDQLTVLLQFAANMQTLETRQREATRDFVPPPADEKLIDLTTERSRRAHARNPIAKHISDVNAICALIEADNASCKANLDAVDATLDSGLLEFNEP